jgi:threonine/homoserine/homoserine lactone efflux protein
MAEPIISGIVLGGVLALLVGPVFFMVINTSIKKGFIPAAILAGGVVMSDALFVVLTYFGSTFLWYMKEYSMAVGITGGLLITIFGIFTFLKEATVSAEALEVIDDSRTRAIDFIKGFSMNMLNPSALLFWLGVAGTVTLSESFQQEHILVFYSVTLGMVFVTDLFKAWVATRLRKVITGKLLFWMNRISGVALTGYGLYVIVKFLLPT